MQLDFILFNDSASEPGFEIWSTLSLHALIMIILNLIHLSTAVSRAYLSIDVGENFRIMHTTQLGMDRIIIEIQHASNNT